METKTKYLYALYLGSVVRLLHIFISVGRPVCRLIPLLNCSRAAVQAKRIPIRVHYSKQVHSQGPSEQKPIKNFGERGTLAYPGTVQILGGYKSS